MSNETTQHTPADVRERVKEPTQAQIDDACMWYRHDFGLLSEKERDSVRFEARQWFRAWGKALSNGDDYAALLRAPRGEGEAVWPGDAENDASFLRSWARYLRTEAQDIREAQDRADWKQQAEYTEVAAARMDQIANRIAALRSDAQGEDRWEDLVFGPITEAYNEAHAARRGEGGGE